MDLDNREKFIKIVIWVIVVAFVTTIFASWGARYDIERRDNPEAINVEDQSIKKTVYYSEVSRRMENARKYSQNDELSDTETLKIRKETADSLIDRVQLKLLAEDYTLKTTENDIKQGVLRQFVDDNGVFNREAFERAKNYYPASWWKQVEQQTAEQIELSKSQIMVSSKAKVTDDELKFYYAGKNLQAKIKQIYLDPTKLIDTDTVKIYYSENADTFVKPEKRFAARIIIADTDTSNDTTYSIERIKINNVMELLKKGDNFGELATKYSDEPFTFRDGKLYKNGELGYITKFSDMDPKLVEKIFELRPYEISEVIRTEKGYEIVKLIEIAEKEYYTMDEKAGEIRWRLLNDTHFTAIKEKMSSIRNDINSGLISFEDAALKYSNANSKDSGGIVGFIPRNKFPNDFLKSPESYSIINEIPSTYTGQALYIQKDFSDSVFVLNINELSGPIKSKYGYHLVKVMEYKVPAQENFEIEIPAVYTEIVNAKQRNYITEWLDENRKNLEIKYNLGDYLERVDSEE